MAMNTTVRTLRAFAVTASCALIGAALLAGCANPAAPEPTPQRSAEQTAALPPVSSPAPTQPAPADLSRPEAAVRSYLDWISYAYRIADSDVASHTMTPEEGVRVDSYVQYNLQERNRRINQQIVEFKLRKETTKASRTTLSATEKWEYGYLSRSGERSMSPTYTTSYETTYTLVRTGDGWVVDSVKAKPLDEVK